MIALCAVGPGELDAKVVINIAELLFHANLSATVGNCVRGHLIILGPHHLVDAVDGLLYDVVATKPGEVVPAADHELDVALGIVAAEAGIAFAGIVVVAAENSLNVTDITVVDALVGVSLRVGPAPDKAIDNGGALFLGLGDALHDRTHAGGVGGHGFLGKDMLAGINGGLDMHRTEAGRRS